MRISNRIGGLGSRGNRCIPWVGAATFVVAASTRGDTMGFSDLRTFDPTLNGGGVRVAQAEGNSGGVPPDFEVNPAFVPISQPSSLFTYYSTNGTSTTFNDSVGQESGHADTVGTYFYGTAVGAATGVSHVDNYDADYFYDKLVSPGTNVLASVVNQSFIVTNTNGVGIQDPSVDQIYDNYIARFNKIIVSGAGNSGQPSSPATSYNGIAVGAYGGASATGPTTDFRSKPDITAVGGETSYSTPYVSGAAAILLQAGARGDGGTGTAATNSQDFRVVKALLLNGAVKPAGWSHTATAPLDPQYGSGVLNVFNSYQQLAGGMHTFITSSNTATLGGPHAPPTGVSGNEPSNIGWDFATLTSGTLTDAVNHYFFNVSTQSTLTATLDWERQDGQSTINDLDLFVYDATSGSLVDQSISVVDNVEHLYDVNLPAGRYDVEVLKHGASTISDAETYALAYNFVATPEPGTGLMVLCGATGLLRRRRRTYDARRTGCDGSAV